MAQLKYLTVLMIVVSIIKVILISKEDTVLLYLPHDDLWQIKAALNWVWCEDYQGNSMLHLPLYPLIIKSLSLMGVPWRICFEILYCFTIYYSATVIYRVGFNRFVVVIAAALTILNPHSFELPNRIAPEIFLGPVTLMAFAASMNWWICRSHNSSIYIGFLAAILWSIACNLRKESIVLIAGILTFGLLIIWNGWRSNKKILLRELMVGVILPIFISLLMGSIFSLANYIKWGLYASTITTSPGYVSLYKELQSIPQKHPVRFIPIPQETLTKAYQSSPSFSKLKPFLSGELAYAWGRVSRIFTDNIGMKDLARNEIAGGWFFLALHDATLAAGEGTNPSIENKFLSKCAAEISETQKNGLLEKRFVPISMIDPNLGIWGPYIPNSVVRIFNAFFANTIGTLPLYDSGNGLSVKPEFDNIANRRSYINDRGTISIGGWLKSLEPKTMVNLKYKNSIVASTFCNTMRPDIDPTKESGFSITYKITDDEKVDAKNFIIEVTNSGSECLLTKNIYEIPPGREYLFSSKTNKGIMGVEAVNIIINNKQLYQQYLKSYESIYNSFLRVLSLIALGLIPILMVSSSRKCLFDNQKIALMLMASIITYRLILFVVLDASSFNGDQPRYLFGVTPMFVFFVVLLLSSQCRIIYELLRKKRPRIS